MKTRLLIIIGIAIMVSIAVTITIYSIQTNNDEHYYPEELQLTWHDDKIIQDADVIVLAELTSYENNQWILGPNHLDAKENTQDSIIKINTIFSEIILTDGKSIKPDLNREYVWFLKHDGDDYRLVSENGIVDAKYYYAIKQAIIKPTIQASIENKKVNLFDPTIPRTSDGLIDYHKLIEIIAKPVFVDLFEDMGITVQKEDLVLMRGPWILMYTEYSSMCGYALVDDNVYWLQSDLHRDTLTKAAILSENPDPCKPSYGSCFCGAQYDMIEKTITTLTYFDESEEAYVGETFQNYLNEGLKVVNVPKKFVVGNHNFAMKPDEITFCGAFVSEQIKNAAPEMIIRENVTAHRYLEGVIKNDQVIFFGLADPMKLCAINDDAKIYSFENVDGG